MPCKTGEESGRFDELVLVLVHCQFSHAKTRLPCLKIDNTYIYIYVIYIYIFVYVYIYVCMYVCLKLFRFAVICTCHE